MDSLTQMVLGAAVGEAVLGKKVGNRAMLWGAIGGSIPDFDVFIGNKLFDELGALVFHRGIMHSIFFAVIFSFLIAYIVHKYYHSKAYHSRLVRKAGSSLGNVLTLGIAGIFSYAGFYLFDIRMALIITAILAYPCIKIIHNTWIHYGMKEIPMDIQTTYWDWYKLFFWSIFTHPILDCFTTFGTQLFTPFSNYRVSFNNISVVDPVYTVPFAACLIIAAHYNRDEVRRHTWNWAGIIISSLYMMFTIFNKSQINSIFESTLKNHGIHAKRFMTSPSILNNILWSGTAETDSMFYCGMYSWLDSKKEFQLIPIPKNKHLLEGKEMTDETLMKVRWFSNNYSSVMIRKDGNVQLNDLRFGVYRGTGEDDFVFHFALQKDTNGNYKLYKMSDGPPKGNQSELFQQLVTRIKGI